jgi:hypothetical protein
VTNDFEIRRDGDYADGTLAATLTVADGVPGWLRERRLGRFNVTGERDRRGHLADSGRLPREVMLSVTEDWSVEGGQVFLFLTRDEVAELRGWLTAWLEERS